MSKRKEGNNLRSNCCNVLVELVGETKPCYQCQRCRKACEVHLNTRKEWTRSPITQIIPNKKKKITDKLSKKEIEHYRKNEDF